MFSFLKHSLPDDFFRGVCDMHCHLLPGVDDGFATTEKSLQALKVLEERGVSKMILTPHIMKDYPDNDRISIAEKFEEFKTQALQVCNIELRLAAEYMLDARFMDHFKQGFLTLDGCSGNHVLCETSYMMYEHGVTEMLYEIMCADYQPVIAHPERYEYASRENYTRWKDKNYKFQLNLLALAGVYGEVPCAKSHALLADDFYDYIGSDMHSLTNFEHFLPKLRLKTKEIDKIEQLIENNKQLFG